MQEVRPLTGGVAFKAGLEQVYAALLWSRVASRVLLIVGRVDATDSDSLYAGVRAIPWEDHIIAGATIAVSARGTNDQLRDTRYTALRAKDAICDRLRDLRGERPDVDAQHPDLRVQVNLRSRRLSRKPRLSRCGAQHLLSRARDACRRHASCGGLAWARASG